MSLLKEKVSWANARLCVLLAETKKALCGASDFGPREVRLLREPLTEMDPVMARERVVGLAARARRRPRSLQIPARRSASHVGEGADDVARPPSQTVRELRANHRCEPLGQDAGSDPLIIC